MDEIFVYITDLPTNITEIVIPCLDGYTVYLNARMGQESQKEGYEHALTHIHGNDWKKNDVQEIEFMAHKNAVTGY